MFDVDNFSLPSSFPGIVPKDNILSLLKLMASKNPNNDIAAQIALKGGYDPCPVFRLGGAFWDENEGCDPDFIPDYANGYCYKVLPELASLDDGENNCEYYYDAEMVLFESNKQVNGLISLIKSGTIYNKLYFAGFPMLNGEDAIVL